ncbi:hypothetical protein M427DRAFT_47591, partial [Gonapodya prolifera JEL478]
MAALSSHRPSSSLHHYAQSHRESIRRGGDGRPQNPHSSAPVPLSYPSPPSPTNPTPVDPASLRLPYGGNWNTWLFTHEQLDSINPPGGATNGVTEDGLRWKAAVFVRRVGHALKLPSTTTDFAILLFQRFYSRVPFRELQPPPTAPPPPPPEPEAPPPPAPPKRDYKFLRKPARSSPLNPASQASSHTAPPQPPGPQPVFHDPRTPYTHLDTAAACLRLTSKLCDRS